jgi:transcriptional regulator with XRE-family HTH domain
MTIPQRQRVVSAHAAGRWHDRTMSKTPISDRIRAARLRVGWTQAALAKAVGVSPGAVSQWEGAGNTPGGISVDHLQEVARVLMIPASDLLDGQTEPGLTITDEHEIAFVELYRRLTPAMRSIHLQLLYEQVAGGGTAKPESHPPKRRNIG